MANSSISGQVLAGIDSVTDLTVSGNLNASGTVTTSTMHSTGIYTNAATPAFSVTKDANQADLPTGSYTQITWQTEVLDQGGNFASNVFTAPVNGVYCFTYSIRADDIDTASSYIVIRFVAGGTNYDSLWETSILPADINWTFSNTYVCSLTASQTAEVQFYTDGGTAQTDLRQDCRFCGFLVG